MGIANHRPFVRVGQLAAVLCAVVPVIIGNPADLFLIGDISQLCPYGVGVSLVY
jgi:hypothetical protein